jgi:SAM-dependent methyltransferase
VNRLLLRNAAQTRLAHGVTNRRVQEGVRREDAPVTDFDELVDEAERAPVAAWDFSWLDGRAVEDRPSWRYFDRVVERTAGVSALLEVQAGVGAMIGRLPSLPALSVATEGFSPSVAVAAPRLRAAGVHLIVTSQTRPGLPFADGSFELLISRHPVEVWWAEIARILRPGGSYFAQHVGPHSLRSLSEFLVGPLPEGSKRHPDIERQAAESVSLVVQRVDVEHPRTVFYDIGAVVYLLRLVPWIVPDFTVARYRDALRELHRLIEHAGAFETTASRMLIEATKPAS